MMSVMLSDDNGENVKYLGRLRITYTKVLLM